MRKIHSRGVVPEIIKTFVFYVFIFVQLTLTIPLPSLLLFLPFLLRLLQTTMNKGFKFDDDALDGHGFSAPPSQSPWEFSGYSLTVAEEHLQRNTTPIDVKILNAKQRKDQRKHAWLMQSPVEEADSDGEGKGEGEGEVIGGVPTLPELI